MVISSDDSSKHQVKFIFVTGGVVSSLGKGIAGASIGNLLESRGLTVTMQKMDPYLNVAPGTMSPSYILALRRIMKRVVFFAKRPSGKRRTKS